MKFWEVTTDIDNRQNIGLSLDALGLHVEPCPHADKVTT